MARQGCPSGPTDDGRRAVGPPIPPAKPGGRPRGVDVREAVDGVRAVLRSGGARRPVPHELPPWETADAPFRRRQADGTWGAVAATPRRRVRPARGRDPGPGAAILGRRVA